MAVLGLLFSAAVAGCGLTMKIAIASSGLGHVARGIEAWALSLARGLKAAGGSADCGLEVRLFAAAPPASEPGSPVKTEVLPCLKRGSLVARGLVRIAPAFAWRWGLTAPYAIEQISFARSMIKKLRREPVDIVHTQDVILARRLTAAARRGAIKTEVILAHGTDESADALQDIPWIQHLAPAHRDALGASLKARGQFVIPNFVASDTFTPPSSTEKERCRLKFGIDRDALVVGYSGAIKSTHKRFNVLIDEVARLAEGGNKVFLLAAGASERDTPELLNYARSRIPGQHRIGLNVPFGEMPDLYRAMDVYVHPAPAEFFGICLLEAMACGVPVVVHRAPVLEWIAGDGGWIADVCCPGFLSEITRQSGFEEDLVCKGRAARQRVTTTFAWDAVCPAFVQMYREVAGV